MKERKKEKESVERKKLKDQNRKKFFFYRKLCSRDIFFIEKYLFY